MRFPLRKLFGFSLPLLPPQQLHHPAGVRLIISLLQRRIELVPFRKFFCTSSGNDPAVIGTHDIVYLFELWVLIKSLYFGESSFNPSPP
jgi:hypothetical protein